MDKNIEALRKAYDEEKTEGNFEKLVAKMSLGDAIWYVELQDIFKTETARIGCDSVKCFGKWTDAWEDETYEHPTLRCGDDSPKLYKPQKLILAGKFSSEGSWRRLYVFVKPGCGDYYRGKYLWAPSVWNDIKHPGLGLYRDNAISPGELVETGGWKGLQYIQLMNRHDPRVFLDEQQCLEMCRKLNSFSVGRMAFKALAKTLRSMQKQLKENVEKYTTPAK